MFSHFHTPCRSLFILLAIVLERHSRFLVKISRPKRLISRADGRARRQISLGPFDGEKRNKCAKEVKGIRDRNFVSRLDFGGGIVARNAITARSASVT